MAQKKIVVSGMSCQHCVRSVTEALAALPGVTAVRVDLTAGTADVASASDLDEATLKKAVEDIGFGYGGVAAE